MFPAHNRYERVSLLSKWYEGLEPSTVFKYFDAISQIPRETGNMDGISSAVLSWLKEMGIKAERDQWNNVKAWKDATPGYEKAPGIMFAAHMDMVCCKTAESKHDFAKDPIDIQLIDGDIITANGTTLGADDGIGMAFALAILASKDIPHPAIEVVFTTDEETDMRGALNLDYSKFNSKLVISLDGDPIGVAGAGEIDTIESFDISYEDIKAGSACYKISVSGLQGGHSGMESTKERANAAMYLNRIVMALSKAVPMQLLDFTSGFGKEGRSTAFAYYAEAAVACNHFELPEINRLLKNLLSQFQVELKGRDEGIEISIQETALYQKALAADSTEKLCNLLCALPDGVFTRSMEHNGLMDSSVNTGVVYQENGKCFLLTTIRSALSSRKQYLCERVERICCAMEIDFLVDCDLPQWDMKISPEVMALCQKIYSENREIIEEGTSECGIFCDRMPQAAVVALGCPYSGAHSTTEQISAGNCKKYFEKLLTFIAELKNL